MYDGEIHTAHLPKVSRVRHPLPVGTIDHQKGRNGECRFEKVTSSEFVVMQAVVV